MSQAKETAVSDNKIVKTTWFIWPLSRPIIDLQITILLLPLLWLIGLEQIIPFFLVIWAFIKLLLTRKKLIVPLTACILSVFIIWLFVSFLAVDIGSDWIVFGRNILMYFSGFAILLIVVNDVQNGRDARRLIITLIILGGIASFVGLLFILGLIPAEFKAVYINNILPGGVKQSQFVQDNILLREVGRPGATLGAISYPRVSSIFLFPNTTALAFIVFMGWNGFAISTEKGLKKWLLIGLLFLQAIIFLFIASRVALVAFLISISILILIIIQRKMKLPPILVPIIGGIVFMLLLFLVILPDNFIYQFVNQTFFNLRADSFSSRMDVYQATIELWQEKPFAGWGTPKEVETASLAPAGTHGEFLGIIFRFGLIGFVLYITVLVAIWFQIVRRLNYLYNQDLINRTAVNFYQTIFVIFLTLNLCGLAYGLYFDLSFVILNWTTIGLAYIKFYQLKQKRDYLALIK